MRKFVITARSKDIPFFHQTVIYAKDAEQALKDGYVIYKEQVVKVEVHEIPTEWAIQ